MADINVERKGPGLWPWVVGLLVLAVLIWALTSLFDAEPEVIETPAVAEDTIGAAQP